MPRFCMLQSNQTVPYKLANPFPPSDLFTVQPFFNLLLMTNSKEKTPVSAWPCCLNLVTASSGDEEIRTPFGIAISCSGNRMVRMLRIEKRRGHDRLIKKLKSNGCFCTHIVPLHGNRRGKMRSNFPNDFPYPPVWGLVGIVRGINAQHWMRTPKSKDKERGFSDARSQSGKDWVK